MSINIIVFTCYASKRKKEEKRNNGYNETVSASKAGIYNSNLSYIS